VPDPLLDHAELDPLLSGLQRARRWYVAYSGGLDSTVLLHLLHGWCRASAGAPPITALHVNHGLQEAAGEWQVHCAWFSELLQVPLRSIEVAVEPGSRGIEAAARAARYAAFEELVGEGEVLFLGHHLDDQVETFFLRLLRGAGVQGLAAMPAQRALGGGRLVRPLLQIPRARLEAYASHHGLDHVEDPTNGDTSLDRNFLRRELLPVIERRWPGYRRTVSRASGHLAGAARTLREALPLPETVYSAMGDPGVPQGELLDVAPEAAAEKLRGWLHLAGLPAPDQALLEEFLRQLRDAAADSRPRLQCSALALQRYRGAVYLLPDPAEPVFAEAMELRPGEVFDIPGVGRIGLQRAEGGGLSLRRGERLGLDWRCGGERCRPVGRSGSAPLKKLLQEAGVPPWWRDRVPLLWLEGELLAVGDLWLCDSGRYRETAGRGELLWELTWERDLWPAFD
jgi:tRNA(Ile)-lysidine synthase